jgi:hypothetical protein
LWAVAREESEVRCPRTFASFLYRVEKEMGAKKSDLSHDCLAEKCCPFPVDEITQNCQNNFIQISQPTQIVTKCKMTIYAIVRTKE